MLDVTSAEEQDPEVGLLGPEAGPRLHGVEVDDVEGESHSAEVVRQDFLLAPELRDGRFQIHLGSKNLQKLITWNAYLEHTQVISHTF